MKQMGQAHQISREKPRLINEINSHGFPHLLHWSFPHRSTRCQRGTSSPRICHRRSPRCTAQPGCRCRRRCWSGCTGPLWCPLCRKVWPLSWSPRTSSCCWKLWWRRLKRGNSGKMLLRLCASCLPLGWRMASSRDGPEMIPGIPSCLRKHLPAFTIPFFIPPRKLCWLRSLRQRAEIWAWPEIMWQGRLRIKDSVAWQQCIVEGIWGNVTINVNLPHESYTEHRSTPVCNH